MKYGVAMVVACLLFIHSRAGILDSVLVFRDVKPDFGLDGFNTVVRNHDVTFGGLHAGIQWQDKYAAGLTYYNIGSQVDDKMLFNGKVVNARLRMGYVAAYAEYTFFENDKWEWALGLRPGIGRVYNLYSSTDGRQLHLGTQYFPLLTPYVSGTYKILYWLGVGGGAGYRMIPVAGLSGPWIDFGVEFFFRPLYERFVRPKVRKALNE